jgi:hypothetical protein
VDITVRSLRHELIIRTLPGLLVLHRTLKRVGTAYPLVAMVTPALPSSARRIIRHAGIAIVDVESLRPGEGRHILDGHDKRFEDTWTKLRAFELVEYDVSLLEGYG